MQSYHLQSGEKRPAFASQSRLDLFFVFRTGSNSGVSQPIAVAVNRKISIDTG